MEFTTRKDIGIPLTPKSNSATRKLALVIIALLLQVEQNCSAY